MRITITITQFIVLFILACRAATGLCADDVVMRFHDKPTVDGNIVRLADLIEVLSGKSESLEKLMRLSVGPAPVSEAGQTWLSEDVIQHLALRGLHPSSIRWSGAKKVQLHRLQGKANDRLQLVPAFNQERSIKQAQANVARAIREYLAFKVGVDEQWQVEPEIPMQYVRTFQSRRNIVSIGGGHEPWDGEQQFVLQLRESTKAFEITVQAQVKLPPLVVFANRPLRREEILTAEALTYGPLSNQAADRGQSGQSSGYFTNIDELVGKQVRRAVSSGLAIQSDFVGDAILVSRNALVEVQSVAGAIVVSTQARALGSGAQGELVQVELLSNRQKLYGTVVDSLTVRIAAQSNRASR